MATRPNHAKFLASIEAAVASMSDPELKRLAFQHLLGGAQASASNAMIETAGKLAQVLAVVVGVIVSVLSFNAAREKEASARLNETAQKQAAAAAPFLQMRQTLYAEAVRVAAVLANQADHSPEEVKSARTRFRNLYVAELSMVENRAVEAQMIKLAKQIDPALAAQMSAAQKAAYDLAHEVRNSLVNTWEISAIVIGDTSSAKPEKKNENQPSPDTNGASKNPEP